VLVHHSSKSAKYLKPHVVLGCDLELVPGSCLKGAIPDGVYNSGLQNLATKVVTQRMLL